MGELQVSLTGICDLVLHNGMLADPSNPYTVAMKKITSKGSRKLTLADYQERDRLEWEGSLYWDDKLGVFIPSDNIERCIQVGAQKSRKGKDVQSCVFCDVNKYPLSYDGPKTKEKLFADERFVLRKGVVVQKSRIIRVRPVFPAGWTLKFSLTYDHTIINERDLKEAINDAGRLVGLGDWRPKYGRFTAQFES